MDRAEKVPVSLLRGIGASWVALGLITSPCDAQMHVAAFDVSGVPDFYFDAVSFAHDSNALTKLDVYVKVPYDDLQFVKVKEKFQARYEVSAVIFGEDGDQTDGMIWREKIVVADFDLTNSGEHFDITKASFYLRPDTYKLSLGLMDMDTRKTSHRTTTLRIAGFGGNSLHISDILLVDAVESGGDGSEEMIPNVSGSFVGETSDFLAYFEVYNWHGPVTIRYTVHDGDGKIVLRDSLVHEASGPVMNELLDLKREDWLFAGYRLTVEASDAEGSATTTKPFAVRWAGMANAIGNLDDAVRRLRYIVPSKQLREIIEASQERKRELFEAFWKARDPTPETAVNELMNEYYRRVAYSNARFSTFKEGWETDMGMVHILFGLPSDVERHPFDIDSRPYEIWYYYDLNRQFVFQDRAGFGEYELVSPLFYFPRDDF